MQQFLSNSKEIKKQQLQFNLAVVQKDIHHTPLIKRDQHRLIFITSKHSTKLQKTLKL